MQKPNSHILPKEKAPEPRTYENEVIEIMETGQEESSPERDTDVNKKREYETAFSVTSPVEIKNMNLVKTGAGN